MGRAAYLSSSRWARVRRAAFKRDGWRCARCGGAGRLEAHHEPPLAAGGDPFALDGIVTLCRRCHMKRHSKRLRADAAWERLIAST